MTTVQKLPQDVQNLLRSGVVICDITRCVSELASITVEFKLLFCNVDSSKSYFSKFVYMKTGQQLQT